MWFEPSTHTAVPIVGTSPEIVRKELAPGFVAIKTLLPDPGVRETGPVVVKVLPEASVKLLLTVVVPEPFPIEMVVAAPPIFKVVATVLNKLPVVFAEIRSADEAPEIVTPFEAVTAPVKSEVESTVNVPFACISPAEDMVTPEEPYPPPIEAEATLMAAVKAVRLVAFGKLIVVPRIAPVAPVAPRV